jgi:ABC-type uncharacterized transport system substrate-binding protein
MDKHAGLTAPKGAWPPGVVSPVPPAGKGGNVTGILSQVEGLPGKHVEIARELFPTVAVIGVLVNPANATHQYQREEVEAAAAKSAIKVIAAEA